MPLANSAYMSRDRHGHNGRVGKGKHGLSAKQFGQRSPVHHVMQNQETDSLMKKLKTTDAEFLTHVESCIDRYGEILVCFRYPYAAGKKGDQTLGAFVPDEDGEVRLAAY